MVQALRIWSDLEQAYFGKNSFGSNTAEIYLYRFMGGVPRDVRMINDPGIMGKVTREDFDNANVAMHDLFKLFASERSAKIEVDGRELGEWLKTARLCHRVHVKVTPS
jgi:hypothetical protein